MSLFIPPEIWEMILDSRQKDLYIESLTQEIEKIKSQANVEKCQKCNTYVNTESMCPDKETKCCNHKPLCFSCESDYCDRCDSSVCEQCEHLVYHFICGTCGQYKDICQDYYQKDPLFCLACEEE